MSQRSKTKRCPYWDSGWCYAPHGSQTSEVNGGGCGGYDTCHTYDSIIVTDREEDDEDD